MSNGIDDIKVGDLKSLLFRIIAQQGPWTLLTLFLIAALFGWISSPLSRQLEDLQKFILENREVIVQTNRQQQIDAGYQNVLLRTMCRNMVVLQQQGQCEPTYYGYDETRGKNK